MVSQISNIIETYGGEIVIPTVAVISMDTNNTKKLQFSGENYFWNILNILYGIPGGEVIKIISDNQKFKKLKEQILSIKTPTELKKQLPRLYELYNEQLEVNQFLLDMEKLANDKDIPIHSKLEKVAKITNKFKEFYSDFNLKREQQFAKDFNLSMYLEKMVKVLENMVVNANTIINIYQEYSLNLNSFNQEDEDKLNLYIAAKFMEKIEIEDNKQRYLFYLTNYFKENVETKVTRVNIKLNDKKINPIILYQRYKKVLVDNPELLAVNFSHTDFKDMTKEETEEFITAYLAELAANWELIPSNDVSVERAVRSSAKRNYRNISLEERKQREEKLIDLYMQKKFSMIPQTPIFE